MSPKSMATIEIISEVDSGNGWTFEAHLLDEDGNMRHIDLHLSWADYNLWSPDGIDPPESVAKAVLAFLAQSVDAIAWPTRLDASMLRRQNMAADRIIPTLIPR